MGYWGKDCAIQNVQNVELPVRLLVEKHGDEQQVRRKTIF
jgi:hypothetical protein